MTQPYTGAAPKSRPGQMTAVMRALPQASGPKVLRIGLVQSGRVIEERVIKQRTHVTVGANEKCMFVVQAQGLPGTFRLFELVGNDYHLNFLDGMAGRVALQTGISDLDSLRGQAKRGPQGTYQVRLTEDARGKVVLGDTTFLFQFVAPPPVQPKPQLPVSVQSGLASQIDWRFTILASFSFLFHFGAVGMLYSDWMDPVINEEVSIAGLVDTMKSLPPPPPPPEPDKNTAVATNAPTDKAAAETKASKGGGGATQGGSQGKGGSISEGERAKLRADAEKAELAILGALNADSGSATGVVTSGSNLPGGDISALASRDTGISTAGGSGLNFGGGGGGALKPGESGQGGLGAIGNVKGGGGPGSEDTKSAEPAKKRATGDAQMGGASAIGQIDNFQRVVAGLRPAFRACYNSALASNPEMSGSVRVTIQIGPGGEVTNASAAPSGSITGAVASCMAGRARGVSFDPPKGGTATLVIPVTFVLTNK